MEELAEVAAGREGWEAAMLFVLQRDYASRNRAAREIDPAFADALARAREAGVRILGRRCRVSLEGVELGSRVRTSFSNPGRRIGGTAFNEGSTAIVVNVRKFCLDCILKSRIGSLALP